MAGEQRWNGFQAVRLFKDQVLGIGSYGKVCRAKCDDLVCAAKLIHETLFDPTAQQLVAPQREHRLPMRRFEQECRFLSTMRHPNIVQYLGVYQDPDTGLPALLMELMDDSLTHFLESSTQPIPYHLQVNICHDIALALSFLHSNDIVHRDLSSNNVLLIGRVRAKVTDFGMAKLAAVGDESLFVTHPTFTMCPGTDVFMPPEAVRDRPVYTEKIDCFSFGVITLQMLTRKFPDPGDRTKEVEMTNQPGIPRGAVAEMRIPEIERRQNHISEVDPNHTLLPVTLDCLKDRDIERPSAHQLCERVAALKESQEYSESVRATQESSVTLIAAGTGEKEGQGQQELSLPSQKNSEVVQNLNQSLREKDDIIREKDDIISSTRQQLQQLKHRLSHELEENERVVANLQSRIDELERQLRVTNTGGYSSTLRMSWEDGGVAPCEMSTEYGAVVDSTAVYVRTEDSRIFAYILKTLSWSRLPDSPVKECPLVIVNDLLTTVGGFYDAYTTTDQLFSLDGESSGRKRWTLTFPSMPTKRGGSTALCTERTLIVAGGVKRGGVTMKTVETMNTETLQWSIVADLPHTVIFAPGAICGDRVYITSLKRQYSSTKSMYTCSVGALVRSSGSKDSAGIWSVVAAPPVTLTTCVSFNGHLLTVGGRDLYEKRTTAVYLYDPTTDSWEVVGNMVTARTHCYAAVLPNDRLMVVGGWTKNGKTDSVEIAEIKI